MSKHVLFVDDEDWSVSAYFDVLRDMDVEVDLAENGDQATRYLSQKKYDLIVLDVMFAPGKQWAKKFDARESGATLLSKIRKNEITNMKSSPEVPVLVLTAITDQRLLDAIKSNKIYGLCRKPISFQVVIDKISEVLGLNFK